MRSFLKLFAVTLLFFGGQISAASNKSDSCQVTVDEDDFVFLDPSSDEEECHDNMNHQNIPLFIVISNGNLQNNACKLINIMVKQQGLLDKLHLTTPLEHAAIPQQTSSIAQRCEYLNNVVCSEENILHCKYDKRIIQNFEIINPNSTIPTDLISTLLLYKSLKRQVIIFCDGEYYCINYLMDQIIKETEPCIHSLIIFNRMTSNNRIAPENVSEINFKAIEHRVYHFFTKSGTGNDRCKRKFFPSNNSMSGFSPSWSKIVNICCTQGADNNLVEFEYPEVVASLNIPELIGLADNFRLNFDLNAVISPPVESCSVTQGLNKPFLFMRRSLQANQNGTKKIQHISGSRTWTSEPLTNEEFHVASQQLYREEMLNDHFIKEHFTGMTCEQPLNKSHHDTMGQFSLNCPHIQEFQDQKTFESASFFVPERANKGIYLVLFIRSLRLETLLNESFELINPSRSSGNKPDYVKVLGTGSTHSYAVLKFLISNTDWQTHQREPVKITFRGDLLTEHANLIIPAYTIQNGHTTSDINFVVYADVQKSHQGYPLRKAGSSVCRIAETIRCNETNDQNRLKELYQPNSMHLVVGDLVRSGSDIDAWFEIISQLASMTSEMQIQNYNSLLAAAIGTHDFTHISTMRLDKLLEFYPQMPIFLHLFVYTTPEEQEIEILKPNDNPQTAHAYFDVGPVRFIHLPYTTEEDGQGATTTIKSWFNPFYFDFTGILKKFIENLAEAREARNRGEIDFIVVFGHAPLAVTPDYDHMHDGLFNFLLSEVEKNTGTSKGKFDLAQKLLPAMIEYGVDVYFSGHNHQYDCCTISTEGNTPYHTGMFTAVTVGLGNQLRKTKPTCTTPRTSITVSGQICPNIQSATISSKKIISLHHQDDYDADNHVHYGDLFVNKLLPAYLKCQVKNHRLKGKLLSTGNRELHTAFDIMSRRMLGSQQAVSPVSNTTTTSVSQVVQSRND